MSYLAITNSYARFCAAQFKSNPSICKECGEPLWDEETPVQRTVFCFLCLEEQASPEARKQYLRWYRDEVKIFGATSAPVPLKCA